MANKQAGGVKRWYEEVSTNLMDDLSLRDWDRIFEWVVGNIRVGESYSDILKKARKWERRQRASISERVFMSLEEDVPSEFQGDPKIHGIDQPRGGGFSIMQNLQKDLKKEEEKERKKASAAQRFFRASVKQAMYWCGPDRTYRLTRQEQEGNGAVCPKCKGEMEKERFTRREKMFRCPKCGFKVPTGKVMTKKVEIEIEPDGNVEVEVTEASKGEK